MKVRTVNSSDVNLLRSLAQRCEPLDVHTPYTYWVVCNFFGEGCFILENEQGVVGYTMTITKDDTLFVWQIGILKEYRKKNYSKLLLEAITNYAKEKHYQKIMVSIAPDNADSYNAFRSFFEQKNIPMVHNGAVDIDIPLEGLKEYEYIYEMKF